MVSCFDHDGAVLPGDGGGGLVLPVNGAARGCCAELLDLVVGVLQAARSLLSAPPVLLTLGGASFQAKQFGLLLRVQPLVAVGLPVGETGRAAMVLVVAVGQGQGQVHSGVDPDLRPLVGLRLGLEGLDAEGDVPAERVLDQPRPGDPVVVVGLLADREVLGPAEADPTDLGDIDHAPTAVHTADVQVPALRNVHRHHRAQTGLEVRRVGATVPAVLPRLNVRLQYRLRGLGGEHAEPVDLLAGLADRRIGRGQGTLAPWGASSTSRAGSSTWCGPRAPGRP